MPTDPIYEQSHTLISSVVTDSIWDEYQKNIETGTNWKLQQINVNVPYCEYTLSITGNGSMTDWTPYNPAPWYGYLRGVTSISLLDGLTNIGSNAFRDSLITSVWIPATVTSIGSSAFLNCRNLSVVNFSELINLESIGGSAFENCALTSALTSLDLSKTNVHRIGDAAFQFNDELTSVKFPNTLTEVGQQAFFSCESLNEVIFGTGLKKIGNSAFYSTGVVTIDISGASEFESFGNSAFESCESLTEVILPAGGKGLVIGCSAFQDTTNLTGVENLGNWTEVSFGLFSSGTSSAFYNSGIESIDLSGFNNIGPNAFKNCEGLKEIKLSSTVTVGEGAFSNVKVSSLEIVGSSTNFSIPEFDFVGYSMDGWTTEGNDNISYENGATIVVTNAISLSASWSPVAYTIEFDPNGGYGTMGAQTFTYDVEQALTSNSFTRTGYTFAGWSTSQDGAVVYADGASVSNLATTDGAVVTLYAVWEIGRYTLTFDTAGGSPIDPITQEYGTAITAPSDPTRTGYTFAGWNTTIPSTMPAGNMTFTAEWSPITYTISFDPNGGSGEMAGLSAVYGESVTLPANTFTLTGYTFAGWNTSADGSGTGYSDGASVSEPPVSADGTVTLYAQWTPITYTILFHANGGTGDDISQSVAYGSGPSLTPNAFVRTGYTFLGWSTSQDGDVVYADGASVPDLSDEDGATVDLYAVWKPITYTVKFDSNGGLGSMDDVSMIYDAKSTLPSNKFFRFGHTFEGWNTKADGSGTAYGNADTVVNLASDEGAVVTLYAQWETIYTPPVDPDPPVDPEPPEEETTVTENPDGSTTTTTTRPDGSSTEVTERPDGSSTTTDVKPVTGGTQTTVTDTDSDGNTTETVTTETVTDAASGGTVTSTVVETTDSEGVTTVKEESKYTSSDGTVTTEVSKETSADGSSSTQSTTTVNAASGVVDAATAGAAVAQMEEAVSGTGSSDSVIIIVQDTGGDIGMTFEPEAVAAIAESGATMEVRGGVGTISAPSEVSDNLVQSTDGFRLVMAVADKTEMAPEQQDAVGDRPTYQLLVVSSSGEVHELGGTVTVTIPYELAEGEDASSLVVYYVDDAGDRHAMPTSYDINARTVTFETDHFSYYVIGTPEEEPDTPVDPDTLVDPDVPDTPDVPGGDTESPDTPEASGSGDGDSTLLYVGIAAAVIVIAIIAVVAFRRHSG